MKHGFETYQYPLTHILPKHKLDTSSDGIVCLWEISEKERVPWIQFYHLRWITLQVISEV